MPKSLPHIGIFWDQRYSCADRHTGVGKHILQVTEGLLASTAFRWVLLAASDQHAALTNTADDRGWKTEIRSLGKPLHLLKWGVCKIPPDQIADLDLLYSPQEFYFDTSMLPMLCTLHGFPYFQESMPVKNLRSWGFRLGRVYQRRLMKKIRVANASVLSVSEALSEETVSRFHLDPLKIFHVGNGVEQEFFDRPLPLRPSRDAGLVQVGGLNAFDGGGEICALLPWLKREEISLDVLGDLHESPYIEVASGFEGVRFHGFVSGTALRGKLTSARALLFVPAAESFGIAGLEALALGVPVIARRVGGVEACLGAAALWLERENDPEEVLEKIRQLDEMQDADYLQLQETGRAWARNFLWETVAERVMAALQKALP